MGPSTIEVSLGLLLISLALYFLYGRRRAKQKYALLHVIERITSRDLASYSLESELKTIIHERDHVIQDQFDKAIHQADMLDLSAAVSRDDLFTEIAGELSGSLDAEEVLKNPSFPIIEH